MIPEAAVMKRPLKVAMWAALHAGMFLVGWNLGELLW